MTRSLQGLLKELLGSSRVTLGGKPKFAPGSEPQKETTNQTLKSLLTLLLCFGLSTRAGLLRASDELSMSQRVGLKLNSKTISLATGVVPTVAGWNAQPRAASRAA